MRNEANSEFKYQDHIKRCLDFIFALLGLVILFPIFIIIAICIKFNSEGPILFKQVRVGRYEKEFYIFKFRTMVVAAESLGPKITIGNDKRVTSVGRVLRKFKLDELPQLFNVLIGEMSLVGPRPEVPEYVELYTPEIRDIILSVRPGITDEASLVMINENEILAESSDPKNTYINEIMPQKLELAIKYVTTNTLFSDIRIIIKTISKIAYK